MPKKTKSLSPPSREFEFAITHSGSIIINCQLCGRIHFGSDENALINDLGEEEYKKLLRDSEKNPDNYVQHDTEMVSWGDIDGKQAVIGCECNNLSKYENLFWSHRYIIADYFSARAQKELNSAKDTKNLADKVKKATDSIK
jgi:hypothetical protein